MNRFCENQDVTIAERALEMFPWLNEAKFENALVDINNYGGLVWHNGTWKGGTWKDGIWRNGDWTKGTWEKGIWHSIIKGIC